jgi:hypothetical protein
MSVAPPAFKKAAGRSASGPALGKASSLKLISTFKPHVLLLLLLLLDQLQGAAASAADQLQGTAAASA